MGKEYLKILGLNEQATLEEVKNAYQEFLNQIEEKKDEASEIKRVDERVAKIDEIEREAIPLKEAYLAYIDKIEKEKEKSKTIYVGEKGDCFEQLGIKKQAQITMEHVDEAHEKVLDEIEDTKRKICDENRTQEERLEGLKKFEPVEKRIQTAYQYCSNQENIRLRNSLIELGKGQEIPAIEVWGAPIKTKITIRKKEVLETLRERKGSKKLEIEKTGEYQVMDGVVLKDTILKCYKLEKKLSDGSALQEEFYSEFVNIKELMEDESYQIALLQAIEYNHMKKENRQQMKNLYIGMIQKNQQGKYKVQRDGSIEMALDTHLALNRVREDQKRQDNGIIELSIPNL